MLRRAGLGRRKAQIVFDDELPAWNYRAIPSNPGS